MKALRDRRLISASEYDASMPQDNRCLKMYLWTQVSEQRKRDIFDKVAVLGSQMIFAGSVCGNFIAMERPDLQLSDIIDQTFAKYMMFPWKNRGGSLARCPPAIMQALERHPNMVSLWPTRASECKFSENKDYIFALRDTSGVWSKSEGQHCGTVRLFKVSAISHRKATRNGQHQADVTETWTKSDACLILGDNIHPFANATLDMQTQAGRDVLDEAARFCRPHYKKHTPGTAASIPSITTLQTHSLSKRRCDFSKYAHNSQEPQTVISRPHDRECNQ